MEHYCCNFMKTGPVNCSKLHRNCLTLRKKLFLFEALIKFHGQHMSIQPGIVHAAAAFHRCRKKGTDEDCNNICLWSMSSLVQDALLKCQSWKLKIWLFCFHEGSTNSQKQIRKIEKCRNQLQMRRLIYLVSGRWHYIYHYHIWWACMIIIYDHHIWCSYIIIIHDHHIWSCMIAVLQNPFSRISKFTKQVWNKNKCPNIEQHFHHI